MWLHKHTSYILKKLHVEHVPNESYASIISHTHTHTHPNLHYFIFHLWHRHWRKLASLGKCINVVRDFTWNAINFHVFDAHKWHSACVKFFVWGCMYVLLSSLSSVSFWIVLHIYLCFVKVDPTIPNVHAFVFSYYSFDVTWFFVPSISVCLRRIQLSWLTHSLYV